MKDNLGNRMKSQYENRTRYLLPRRCYTLLRVDGKAFHTFNKGLERPFDLGLIEDMDLTAAYLCKNIMGAKFAFVQSDEINILVTDFEENTTQAWFDGNIQKIASVSASMATRAFNEARMKRLGIGMKWAEFDSRVFQISDKEEVANYFVWRQQDTVRNSISSVAQSLYNHKELNGKNTTVMQEMIFQKGLNWNDFPIKQKRGRFILRQVYEKEPNVIRSAWVSIYPPTFIQDRDFILGKIPTL